jgi:hypothetical protein
MLLCFFDQQGLKTVSYFIFLPCCGNHSLDIGWGDVVLLQFRPPGFIVINNWQCDFIWFQEKITFYCRFSAYVFERRIVTQKPSYSPRPFLIRGAFYAGMYWVIVRQKIWVRKPLICYCRDGANHRVAAGY